MHVRQADPGNFDRSCLGVLGIMAAKRVRNGIVFDHRLRKICADHEEVSLDLLQHFFEFRPRFFIAVVFVEGKKEPQRGVQFIDGPDRFDPKRMLGEADAPDDPCGLAVPGPSVNSCAHRK